MRNIFLIGLLFFSVSMIAQENNCYQKYIKVFEVRGANVVDDGEYDDVIITIRKGSYSDCLIGRVKVINGIVDPKSIKLTFVDGSFESFDRSYKYEDPITIINGVSKTLVTKDEELVNVMFVDAIKPKKKAFKRAPEPEFDL